MKERILAALAKFERDEEVKIFFACESSNRAWNDARTASPQRSEDD